MKRPILRETVPHSPFLSDNAVAAALPAGIFDNRYRTGAAFAAATLLAAIGAIAIATMTGAGADPASAPSGSLTLAVARATGEGDHPAQQSAADPRGPRVIRKAGAAGALEQVEAATPLPPALPYVKALPAAAEADETLASDATTTAPRTTGSVTGAPVKARADDGPDGGAAKASKAVPIADSEDQVVALEARMGRSSPFFMQPDLKARTAATAPAPANPVSADPASAPAPTAEPARHATAKLGAATTTTWVNMHVKPGNDARVIATVPAKASIKAEANCKFWCQVEYDGRFGYIYKDFVTRPGKERDVAASQ